MYQILRNIRYYFFTTFELKFTNIWLLRTIQYRLSLRILYLYFKIFFIKIKQNLILFKEKKILKNTQTGEM